MGTGNATREVDANCDSKTPSPVFGLVGAGCVAGCYDGEVGAEANEHGYHSLRTKSLKVTDQLRVN